MQLSKKSPVCKVTKSLESEDATLQFGRLLSGLLTRGDCLLFEGDLGMGKTTMIRGILSGAAAQHGQSALDVPSPTFTLVQIYPFPDVTFYHYDLYRLPDDENNATALMEIGFDESVEDGIALVEWPQRLGNNGPRDALHVTLENGPGDSRICTLSGDGRWDKILRQGGLIA